jgi:hypothetical protein
MSQCGGVSTALAHWRQRKWAGEQHLSRKKRLDLAQEVFDVKRLAHESKLFPLEEGL